MLITMEEFVQWDLWGFSENVSGNIMSNRVGIRSPLSTRSLLCSRSELIPLKGSLFRQKDKNYNNFFCEFNSIVFVHYLIKF